MVDPLADIRTKLMTPLKTEVQGQTPAWRVDPTYDNALRSIQTGIAGLSSNVDLQEGRAKTDLQKNQQNLLKSRDDTLTMLQEKLANQGILRSSINLEEQGNIQGKYAEGKTGLETGYTRSMEDLARETLGKFQGYNEQLAQSQVDRATRQTEVEKAAALAQAQADSDKKLADETRTQLEGIKADLLKQLTPQPTPTGQLTLPPPVPAPKPLSAPKAPSIQPPAAPKANPDEIKKAQGILRLAGFDPGPEDGLSGPKTIAALNKYRTSHGLPPTGTITPDDVAALVQWLNESQT
jgi:hypothetical protein